MPKSDKTSNNAIIVALRLVFGPLVTTTARLPAPLAYGSAIAIAVLVVVLLGGVIPWDVIWPLAVLIALCLAAFVFIDWDTRRQHDRPRITGNVLFKDGTPVRNAVVRVMGEQGEGRTDDKGYFSLAVFDQDSWEVTAADRGKITQKSVKRDDARQPIQLVLERPGQRHEETGDEQIDGVLKELNLLHDRYGEEIQEVDRVLVQFDQLFQRDAFYREVERTNPDGWKALLYVVTTTELLLREYRPLVRAKKPGKAKSYDELLDELRKLKEQISRVFGDGFDTAVHIDRFKLRKKNFVDHLPDPTSAGSYGPDFWKEANQRRNHALELVSTVFSV